MWPFLSRSGCGWWTAGNHPSLLYQNMEELALRHQVDSPDLLLGQKSRNLTVVWVGQQEGEQWSCVSLLLVWRAREMTPLRWRMDSCVKVTGRQQCASVCFAAIGAFLGSFGGVIGSLPTKWSFLTLLPNKRLGPWMCLCFESTTNMKKFASDRYRNGWVVGIMGWIADVYWCILIYTNTPMSPTPTQFGRVCVLSGRSSGFGVGARTRPDGELLSNTEWSPKPLLWLRVNDLYLNPLTCCCISRWQLYYCTIHHTDHWSKICFCFVCFFTFAVAVNTATVDIIYFTTAVVLQLPLPGAEECTGGADITSHYVSVTSVCICQSGTKTLR